jgi:hypothetical protein
MDELTAKLGRGKSVIYARVKLLDLPQAVLAAAEEGKLPASHLELLTRFDDSKVQQKLAKEMLNPKLAYVDGAGGVNRDVVSFREAKAMTEVMQKEVSEEEAWKTKTANYQTTGYTVLSIAASEKVFNYGNLRSDYVRVESVCELDPEKRTWKALLGKHAPTPIVAHARYDTNKIAIVFPRKAAEKALKEAGHDFGTTMERKFNAQEAAKKQEEKEAAELARKQAEDCERIAAVVRAVETREPNAEWWRWLATRLTSLDGPGGTMLERRGIAFDEKDYRSGEKAMLAVVAKADGRTLRGIATEMFCWDYNRANVEAVGEIEKVLGLKFRASGKAVKGGAK